MTKKVFLLLIGLSCMGTSCMGHFSKTVFTVSPCLGPDFKLPDEVIMSEGSIFSKSSDHCKILKNYHFSQSKERDEKSDIFSQVGFLDSNKCQLFTSILILDGKGIHSEEELKKIKNRFQKNGELIVNLILKNTKSVISKKDEPIFLNKEEFLDFCKKIESLN